MDPEVLDQSGGHEGLLKFSEGLADASANSSTCVTSSAGLK